MYRLMTIRTATLLLLLGTFFFSAHAQAQSHRDLIKAIRKGNLPAVQQYLDQGGEIDASLSKDGCSMLYYAVRNNQKEIAAFLLNNGADPNMICRKYSILCHAVQANDLELVKALLRNGAQLTQIGEKKLEPLLLAAEFGNIQIVKELVEYGAPWNIKNNRGINVHDLAIEYGHKNVANYLEMMDLYADSLRIMPDFYDGPHVVKLNHDSLWVFYLIHERAGNTNYRRDKILQMTGDSLVFNGFGPDIGQSYTIYKKNPEQPAILENIHPILVIGDVHGKFQPLSKVLINNQVIDDSLNWKWGKGHLVFLGDVFDRGYEVSQVLWLIYRLERQAKKAGGDVHLLLGNHEVMSMLGDHKYLNIRYRFLMNYFFVNYAGLYTDHTMIGHWLRSKNTVARFDNLLFSHAGISNQVMNKELSIDSMNIVIRDFLNLYSEPGFGENEQLLLLADGPMWFRGYARELANGKAVSQAHVDSVLNYYNADYQIIGHSPVKEITVMYNGRVIDIDVPFGRDGVSNQALLIKDDKIYRVFSDREKEFLMPYDSKKDSNN